MSADGPASGRDILHVVAQGSLSKVLDRDRGSGLSHGAEAAVSRLREAAVFPETGLSEETSLLDMY